jgi:hypothetical protein
VDPVGSRVRLLPPAGTRSSITSESSRHPVIEVQDVTEGLGIDVYIILVAKEAKALVDHDIRPKWIRWARG